MRSIEQIKKSITDDPEIWYDPRTNSIGFGKTYGEHSFNGRPIGELPVEEFFKARKPHSKPTSKR